MRAYLRAALVVAMMLVGAVSTLALTPVPATSQAPEVDASPTATTAPATPSPPPPTQTPTPTPTPEPPPAATTPPSPTATPTPSRPDATPTAPIWPRTPDDNPAAWLPTPVVDPALVPRDAWYTQEAVDSLRADLAALLAGRAGRYGIVIASADGYVLYEQRADERFEAASLYKLAVLVEIFRQRESGRLAFDDVVHIQPEYLLASGGEVLGAGDDATIDTLVRQMITWSSNVSGWALLDVAGLGNVNRTMAGLGLRSTALEYRPLPSLADVYEDGDWDRPHVTSPADLARLYHLLLAGKVVSPQASADMLDLLADQRIRNRLPARLPWDTVVAHKTGNLPGIVHDAGVIFTPGGPLIVIALTEDVIEWEATDLIARIGERVYEFGASAGTPQSPIHQ